MLIRDDNTDLIEKNPIIIPLTIKVYPKKEPEIKYYPEFEFIAKKISEYKNPLCDDALEMLYDETENIVEEYGYVCEKQTRKSYIKSYFADKKDEIKREKIQKSSEILTNVHLKLKNVTTVDADEMLEYHLKSYITVEDEKIVSIASVNPFSDGNIFELNVQTAPKYRGKGYAVSNVAALAYDLLESGSEIIYDCRRYNRGSQKTAESAGLKEFARFYMMACYKK